MQTMTKFHAAVSVRLGAALCAVLFGLCARAQDYPSRFAEIRDKLAVQGAEVAGGSPEEFAAVIQADSLTWSRVVKDAGIRVE